MKKDIENWLCLALLAATICYAYSVLYGRIYP